MKNTYITLCLSLFLLIPYQLKCDQVSHELQKLINENKKDTELQRFLSNFPFFLYEVYDVKGLGSFYVDDIPDAVKWHLVRGIYWEEGIGKLIDKHTRRGTIAIDAGAHIGIHTITMSKKVGSKGKVISFEPQRKIYRELFYNTQLNACGHNTILLRNALGNKVKKIQMKPSDPINEGGTQIGKGGDSAKMVTLDSLNLENVSLIKIDVESYEKQVLEGAKDTILRCRPVLIFEILGGKDYNHGSPKVRREFEEIIEYVESLNYWVQLIHGNDYIAFPKCN